jgi:hypothetical protein
VKPVVYVAHPVTGDPRGNCAKVQAWIRWLIDHDPDVVYIAPWVAEVLAYADVEVSPDFYDRVLEDDCTVVKRLDGVLLVGGRISRGMQLEAAACYGTVVDWTSFESPDEVPAGWTPGFGGK